MAMRTRVQSSVKAKPTEAWLTTTELCLKYRVGVDLVRKWRGLKTFPDDATKREGACVLWNSAAIDDWLRSRPIARTGRLPGWLAIVGTQRQRRQLREETRGLSELR